MAPTPLKSPNFEISDLSAHGSEKLETFCIGSKKYEEYLVIFTMHYIVLFLVEKYKT